MAGVLRIKTLSNINRCDMYFASWCLYYLQGTLYPESSSLSKILFIINMAIASYYVFHVNKHYKIPALLKSINILLILFTIYGIALYLEYGLLINIHGEILDNNLYLKAIYLSLFPIYPFYEFSIKGYITKEKLRFWTIIFFVVTTCSFFYEEQKRIAMLLETGSNFDGVTNNTSYMFLSLIPFLVLFRGKPVIQYVGLSYCLYFVFIGMKRGAILIALICLCFFIYDNYKNSSSKRKFFLFLLTLVFLFIGFKFISDKLFQNDYFQDRLYDTLEGNSSGRDEIYTNIWDTFLHADIINAIFGFGAQGSFIQTGKFAHSDWLELLINNGILGFCLYFYFWKQYYMTWSKTNNINIKNIIGLLFLIFFIKSFFSMSYASYTYYTNCLLGYCLANQSINKNSVNRCTMRT